LEDGTAVSILDIVDKGTGIQIKTAAIDVTRERGKRRRKVNWREVQQALRTAFQEWGLPERIQTDKELVFEGHPADLYPSSFQQWLVGLGIQFERTRPGRPQDQSRVERSHRTFSDFTYSKEDRQNLANFQKALTQNRHLYNTKFPSRAKGCQGQPPLVAHPEALIPRRPYLPEEEWALFSLDRVAQLLAQHPLKRKVNAAGQISLANRLYYVGNRYAGQYVELRFDTSLRQWCVWSEQGEAVKCFSPPRFTKSYFLDQFPLTATQQDGRDAGEVSEVRPQAPFWLLALLLLLAASHSDKPFPPEFYILLENSLIQAQSEMPWLITMLQRCFRKSDVVKELSP